MIDNKELIVLLKSIEARPNMYFYDGSFVSATAFISGFLCSVEFGIAPNRHRFSQWMQKKYNKVGALSFEGLSIVYFDEQEKVGIIFSEDEKVTFLFENLIEYIQQGQRVG